MKKAIAVTALALIVSITFNIVPPAVAIPSEWAAYEVDVAYQWGLVNPYILYEIPSQDTITKDMLCEMVVTLCEKLTNRTIAGDYSVTFDDDDWYIPDYFYRAYAAGIVAGKGFTTDGKVILGKTDEMNREEVFTMLYNAIVYCYPGQAVDNDSIVDILSVFSDVDEISFWARRPAAYMTTRGIVRGADGRYMPKDSCTVEQSIVTVKRLYESFSTESTRSPSPLLTRNLAAPEFVSPDNGSSHDIKDGVILRWTPVDGARAYRVRMTTDEGLLDHYVNQPSASLDAWLLTDGTNIVSVAAVDDNRQVISNQAYMTLEVYGERPEFVYLSTRNEDDYVFDFTSREEALLYMTTVTIPVWRINSSGQKYSTTTTVTVHRYVAGDILTIFNEIFNGPERFPIRSIGGFDWRYGSGEHPMGTAVDINPTENYQIYPNGRIGAGSFWRPGENPYSIPVGGDVERAFRRLGWGWGGLDWRSNNDYMHFSFFGT